MSDKISDKGVDRLDELLDEIYQTNPDDDQVPRDIAKQVILKLFEEQKERAYKQGWDDGWNRYNEAPYNPRDQLKPIQEQTERAVRENLEYILNNASGGGNWRRVIIQRLDQLKSNSKGKVKPSRDD